MTPKLDWSRSDAAMSSGFLATGTSGVVGTLFSTAMGSGVVCARRETESFSAITSPRGRLEQLI
jgi:hypothetical protein